MSWLGLAWANLRLSPLTTAVNVLLMTLGTASVVLLILAGDRFASTLSRDAQGIDLVVGAKGSPAQLILSAVYHADIPPGNIALSDARPWLEDSRIGKGAPVSLGDSFRGFRIVGTTPDYLALTGTNVAEGARWRAPMQAVIGAAVARSTGLSVGSRFAGAHGFADGGHEHDSEQYRVVGILAPVGSVVDRLILTSLESVWRLHGQGGHDHEEEHEHDAGHGHDSATHDDGKEHGHGSQGHDDHEHESEGHDHEEGHAHEHESEAHDHDEGHDHEHKSESHDHDEGDDHEHELEAHDHDEAHDHEHESEAHDHEEGHDHEHESEADDHEEGHDHEHASEADDHEEGHDHEHDGADEDLEITAVLLQYRTPLAAMSMPLEINAASGLQAAAPAVEIARILQLVGLGMDGLRAFAWVLIVTACLSVFAALYGSLRNRRGDLAMLRCLGATRSDVFLAMVSEGMLMSVAGIILGYALGHSAIGLVSVWLESSRGVALAALHWAPAETQLLFVLLAASVLSALIPAIQAYRTDVAQTLAEGGA